MRKILLIPFLVLLAALVVAATASGHGKGKGKHHGRHFGLPATIALPPGFRPEGIAIKGHTFFVGSIPTGAVYRGSLLSGKGDLLVQPQANRAAIGIDYDHGRLFVAGGPTGKAFVYDARTGADLGSFQLTTASPTFINDVIVTKDAAWFTDSNNQALYKLAFGPGKSLPAQSTAVPLTGDIKYIAGFNVNGIDATRNGKTLVIVQSNEGFVFTVDAATGVTHRIDLGGVLVKNGDGILLEGKRLFVVQNQDNKIAVIRLRHHLQRGTVIGYLTAPGQFDVPTTIDRFGPWLYAVNARFTTPPTPTTSYTIVRVPAH